MDHGVILIPPGGTKVNLEFNWPSLDWGRKGRLNFWVKKGLGYPKRFPKIWALEVGILGLRFFGMAFLLLNGGLLGKDGKPGNSKKNLVNLNFPN